MTDFTEAALSLPDAEVDNPARREKVDALLAAVAARQQGARLPTATYRLQFTSEFTFAQAVEIVPYLAELGISDVYASPFLQSAPGSQHGYDVVDHGRINAEIGAPDEFAAFAEAIQRQGLGLLVDVVPNHMCASPDQNAWWRDVLENGESSHFAPYFDIDWLPLKPDLEHKVLLPVLEDQYGKVLESGLLQVKYHDGAFSLAYHDRHFPLAPKSWLLMLDWHLDELEQTLGADHPHLAEYLSILAAIRHLPERTETGTEQREERHREKETSKRRLHALTSLSAEIAAFVAANVRQIQGTAGEAATFDRLDQLIDEQPYRLAYWRAATDEINYRRFFDINDLAAICMERPEVFEATHALTFDWIARGWVNGLRIDHPDGLFDPPGYLRQLQQRRIEQQCRDAAREMARTSGVEHGTAGELNRPSDAAEKSLPDEWEDALARAVELWREGGCIPGSPLARPLYVVVEKILGHHEEVPQDWPVYGTVGYEFLNALGGVLVDAAGEKSLSDTYGRFTGEALNFRELEYACKRLIARMSMASELHVLGYHLDRMSERNRWTRDFTLTSLIETVQEVVSCFSVYRTYVQDEVVMERDRQYVEGAIARAKRRNPAMDASIFDFLRDVLLLRQGQHADADDLERRRKFVGKFQQLTGPIMAKSVEDTAFYRYNRLVSLNEVGGEPARFGNSVDEFHRLNLSRLPRLSHGLSATTTHDTKRSEDVRARISVLSEAPQSWRKQVMQWARWHRRLKTSVEGEDAPSRNDEYLLYQTLVGVWPGGIPTGDAHAIFVERIQQYVLKVAREAKVHTSWVNPHQDYEAALQRFVAGVLESDGKRPFMADLDRFAKQVIEHGYWNSLSQMLLKIGSPGVPDFFQGTEDWTLTLVDPDNRRPVDFDARRARLGELRARMTQTLETAEADPLEAWLALCVAPSSPAADAASNRLADLVAELLAERQDGRIKLFAMQLALRLRAKRRDVFTSGDYVPLAARGPAAEQVVAFARRQGERQAILVAPRATVRLTGFGGLPPVGELWGETALELPWELAGQAWCDIYTGRRFSAEDSELPLAKLFEQLPFALLATSTPGWGR